MACKKCPIFQFLSDQMAWRLSAHMKLQHDAIQSQALTVSKSGCTDESQGKYSLEWQSADQPDRHHTVDLTNIKNGPFL